MGEQVLSVEQMQELIDMGIDVSKASMYWSVNKSNARGRKNDLMPPFLTFHKINQVVGLESFDYIPTFTLQDILSFFEGYQMFRLSSGVTFEVQFNDAWAHAETDKDELSVGFSMLKWCKENNLI